MEIKINVQPKTIVENCFEFGNIASAYDANSVYFTKNGKPYVPIAGEFHFSRYDCREWERELLKMKASGLNTVSTYFFWNHHEREMGKFDFDGNMNIKAFLEICRKIDMQCILRIGPWAHGEVKYGGFPDYIYKMAGNRSNNENYLSALTVFWKAIFEQVKDYLDGKTVIGIQLENEYNGPIEHIHKLKEIAMSLGFAAPFFSMTAWPTKTPDKTILPTFGGYPEAPWAGHKRKLKDKGRFAISEGRTDSEIGGDLAKSNKSGGSFGDFPYAGCEVGVGNEVTQMRRPIIGEKDGYGVALAKFASGMNWMGYYMYHGGRNPNFALLQESRITAYPNDYPIIDYDFQSPFGKNGEKNAQCDRLRLMHTFIATFDKDLAKKQAFFPAKIDTESGKTPLYSSVRCDENLSGYAFVSSFDRLLKEKTSQDVTFEITNGSKTVKLPKLNVAAESMFFFPFNLDINGVNVDYILAQPITFVGKDYYFAALDGIIPEICVGGKVQRLGEKTLLNLGDKEITIYVLPYEKAKTIYRFGKKIYFSQETLFEKDGKVVREKSNIVGSHKFALEPCNDLKLPHNFFLYSHGKRVFYALRLDKKIIAENFDVELIFNFVGLNLQLFCGDKLIDDCFNTNGKYRLRLRMLADEIGDSEMLIIKAVPATRFGVSRTYNEINIPYGKTEITLEKVSAVNIVDEDKNI
ncbi:MAG: beta-galactosidase [Clostridia bacterium]